MSDRSLPAIGGKSLEGLKRTHSHHPAGAGNMIEVGEGGVQMVGDNWPALNYGVPCSPAVDAEKGTRQ